MMSYLFFSPFTQRTSSSKSKTFLDNRAENSVLQTHSSQRIFVPLPPRLDQQRHSSANQPDLNYATFTNSDFILLSFSLLPRTKPKSKYTKTTFKLWIVGQSFFYRIFKSCVWKSTQFFASLTFSYQMCAKSGQKIVAIGFNNSNISTPKGNQIWPITSNGEMNESWAEHEANAKYGKTCNRRLKWRESH